MSQDGTSEAMPAPSASARRVHFCDSQALHDPEYGIITPTPPTLTTPSLLFTAQVVRRQGFGAAGEEDIKMLKWGMLVPFVSVKEDSCKRRAKNAACYIDTRGGQT